MKASAFYKRAAADAVFRQAKLDDLHYFRKVEAGLFWLCVAGAAALSLYGGLTAGTWLFGEDLGCVAAVTGSFYLLTKTRIAALEALDPQKA